MNDDGFEIFTGLKHALMIEGMVVFGLLAAICFYNGKMIAFLFGVS